MPAAPEDAVGDLELLLVALWLKADNQADARRDGFEPIPDTACISPIAKIGDQDPAAMLSLRLMWNTGTAIDRP